MEGYGNENPGAFQPTRPLRGATHPHSARSHLHRHFNPRAPCGARPEAQHDGRVGMAFQPTRPLRGATITLPQAPSRMTFQPTRPLRGATFVDRVKSEVDEISTHAPLAGRDLPFGRCASNVLLFQPTRPLRGATVVSNIMQERTISTHAPLAGRDNRGC